MVSLNEIENLSKIDDRGSDAAEQHLMRADPILSKLITAEDVRWKPQPSEQPIWGLLRMVMAQQVTTERAIEIARLVAKRYPKLVSAPMGAEPPTESALRGFGLPAGRARCCREIVAGARHLADATRGGPFSDEKLLAITGIGPWTVAVFRIFVLREPDILPLGDVGLDRAIRQHYGRRRNVIGLSKRWRPFRSVACWYLWRSLGNMQLG
jgi:DNA-3-methyladenine glycosylase II